MVVSKRKNDVLADIMREIIDEIILESVIPDENEVEKERLQGSVRPSVWILETNFLIQCVV